MQLTTKQTAATDEAKQLICELCHNFYQQGWVGGTGGGMSIKADDLIVMAPSGVQKERMVPDDMFVLDQQGTVLIAPVARPAPYKAPKLSECSPLFMAVKEPDLYAAVAPELFALDPKSSSLGCLQAYELRSAGAVAHSHSLNAVMATLIDPSASEFTVTNLEMIKGIAGHGYYDACTVPIIENTARECELTDRLRQAIKDYPKTQAVLVRRHGVYVWGNTWIQAKTQAECYDYLFESAIKMKSLGIDVSKPAVPSTAANGSSQNGHAQNGHAQVAHAHNSHTEAGRAAKRHKGATQDAPKVIVLDIEGTVAPISFVHNTMFPYIEKKLRSYLEKNWESADMRDIVTQLQAEACTVTVPGMDARWMSPDKHTAMLGIEQLVGQLMKEDKKLTVLKALQGRMWEEGFANGELTAELYGDVQPAMAAWVSQGLKTYIYSSGSRQAQKNLFAFTKSGDLRGLLSGYFDTTSGVKVESSSYSNIALSLGVDKPSQILFATDAILEAKAAAAAGWQVALTIRPGNKPWPPQHCFRVIHSMQDLIEPF